MGDDSNFGAGIRVGALVVDEEATHGASHDAHWRCRISRERERERERERIE